MAIKDTLPAIKPTLLLDFANTKTLDPRITFTRASTATYYDGKTVAKAEENLLTRSETFGTWSQRVNVSISSDSTTAPNGTTTADSVTQASGITTSGYVATFDQVFTVAGVNTYSVHAKPNGKNFIVLFWNNSGGFQQSTWFNVSTGVVGTTSAGVTASIVSAGSGWYRCIITFSNTAYTINPGVGIALADTNGSMTVTDSGGVFLWGAQFEQRSAVTAYTPTTTAPITNYIPALQTAPAGVPRFDHNPVTGESLGLLIEEARTNLLTYSEQFDNAAWSKNAATIYADVAVSPDGTNTADKFVADATSAAHYVGRSGVALAQNVISIYAKAAGYSFLQIIGAAAAGQYANFNLTTGLVAATGADVVSASMTPVGGGWCRCSISLSTGAATVCRFLIVPAASSGWNEAFAGDGTSGIYIWGAQLEAGAFATSYIPTGSSQVTRAADSASMTGGNFSSWYRADEGTLYGEADFLAPLANTNSFGIVAVGGGSASENIGVYKQDGQSLKNEARTGGVTQATILLPFTSQPTKAAFAFKLNSFNAAANGAVGIEDASGTVPAANALYVGGIYYAGGGSLNGTIKKLAYYPARLTNAQLQSLTA